MTSRSINNFAAASQWADSLVNRLGSIPANWWRQAVIAGLLIWLCFALAKLFWLLAPTPGLVPPGLEIPRNLVQANSSDGELAAVDIQSLASLPLFGDGSAVVVQAPLPEIKPDIGTDAPETRLKLFLRGTMTSTIEQGSQATIGENNKEVTYRIGEELEINTRGVKLAKIMVDRVILENNGDYETLYLHFFENNGSSKGIMRTSQRPTQFQRPRAPIATPSEGELSISDAIANLAPQADQQQPSEVQLNAVSDLISVSMHREGGKLLGYKIRPKKNAELFEQLGLQPNDVVTAVNGVVLEDTSKAMEAYRSLNQSTEATLEILRGGTTTTVQVSL